MGEAEVIATGVDVVKQFGLAVGLVVILLFFAYLLVKRIMDEAKNREGLQMTAIQELQKTITSKDEKIAEQDDKFSQVGRDFISCMKDIEKTIKETNEVHTALAETNRLLADKVEGKVDDLDGKVDIILDRIEHMTYKNIEGK